MAPARYRAREDRLGNGIIDGTAQGSAPGIVVEAQNLSVPLQAKEGQDLATGTPEISDHVFVTDLKLGVGELGADRFGKAHNGGVMGGGFFKAEVQCAHFPRGQGEHEATQDHVARIAQGNQKRRFREDSCDNRDAHIHGGILVDQKPVADGLSEERLSETEILRPGLLQFVY